MTYLKALSELQQHGIDALKVAGAMQLTALATTRECAAALTESTSPALGVPAVVSDMTSSLTSFAFQMLEQQVAFAKELADSLVPTRAERSAPAETPPIATASESVMPLVIHTTVEPELLRQSETTADPTAAQLAGVSGSVESAAARPLIGKRAAGAEAWLDATMAAADQSEALSKALPAPGKPAVSSGPRVSNSNPAAKKPKVPSVSGDDRPSVKRGSTPK